MKKLILLMVLFCNIIVANAQRNDTVLYVENIENGSEFIFCKNHTRALVYPQPECESFYWEGSPFGGSNANPLILDPDVATFFSVTYIGCDLLTHFAVIFGESSVPGPTLKALWKRQDYTETLEAVGIDSLNWFNYQWNTGETTGTINVTEPGTYICEISDLCGTVTRTFIVKDNVEIYRATCDLRSNLNKVTWLTTPEQAEYIREVKIYRNTYQLVATVPYTDGSFTDDIGSDATQWQYHIVGVDTDGNDCPLPSYWKRTIHLDHVQGTQGEILQWTPYEEENPSKDVVIAYAIYDVVNGEPQHVIDVGNFTNVFAYDPANFDGYGTVAAVFEGKSRDMEDLAFSNLTAEVLDISEGSRTNFSVYPNPTNGTFTVEGAKTLTIINAIGQVVARSNNDNGKHQFTLASGIYFVKSDEGIVKKVVVE
jgi:hypothetical protein